MNAEAVAAHIHQVLPEFLEGYLVVGSHAATGEPIVRFWAPTPEAAEQMNKILKAVVAAGGVKFEQHVECELNA